jgi:FdhD protein
MTRVIRISGSDGSDGSDGDGDGDGSDAGRSDAGRRNADGSDARLSIEAREDTIAVEAPLEIRIAGKAMTVVMRTPGHDEELVRGFLYAEGIITRGDDIVALARPERLTGDEVGNVLDVTLRPGAAAPKGERLFYASSSCGVCGKNAISALTVRAPIIESSICVTPSLISSLPDRLRAAQPMFAATGGVHASGLFTADGTLELVREDVGRHNALDKIIGWAVEKLRVPLSNSLLLVSGRVSYELVQKAIAVGLPLLAAVGAPSSLAVDLAEQFGVTLVGFVRGASMNVYAHADRIREK